MSLLPWAAFLLLVLGALALDLGVLSRRDQEPTVRAAFGWTVFWISLGVGFSAVVYFGYGHGWLGLGREVGLPLGSRRAALEYLTGYVVEKSLSLDNIFVFAAIFAYFRVPRRHQHRVLYWGILGALVLRGAMIAVGVALVRRFDWILYVFGAILIVTAIKLARSGTEAPEPERNPLVRLARRLLPISPELHGDRLLVRREAGWALTPLFIVLLVIESSDVLFAVDSIPAVFAVTLDPFLVFTSNVFAILGLRSLYFFLAAVLDRFRYLDAAVVAILGFVGLKMLAAELVHVPTGISLGVIAGILVLGIGASMIADRRHPE